MINICHAEKVVNYSTHIIIIFYLSTKMRLMQSLPGRQASLVMLLK